MAPCKSTLVARWERIDEAWRFAIMAFLVMRLLYTLWAAIVLTVQPLAVQNIELNGQPVLTIFNLRDSQAYTYLREIQGRTLSFQAAGPGVLTDRESGSIWDISTGRSVTGAYEGLALAPAMTPSSEIFPYHNAERFSMPWLAVWQRFDVNWYLSIAENGYGSVRGDDHFPPLFPVLIRILQPLFGEAFLAGLVISHLATLFVIKFLYETFREWGPTHQARGATLFLLIYPTSFFVFSVYSESLFLLAALLSLRHMRRSAWAWAGFWAFCAILARLQGAALIVPLLYLMWRDQPFLRRSAHWMGLALPALGGLFFLFLRSRQVTDGAMPFVEPDWHARLVLPWETYWYSVRTLLSGTFTFVDFLNWAVATLFLVLLVLGWRRIPLEYSLYTAFSLFIMLIRIVETQPLISMSRYSLTLFPSFFVLGLAGENPWGRRVITYIFLPLNLYLSAQFLSWGWVA